MTKKDLFVSLKNQYNLSSKSRYLKREEAYKYLIKYAREDNWEGFNSILTEFLFEFSALNRIPELQEKDMELSEFNEEKIITKFMYSEMCQNTDTSELLR